jgi:hypothetical protein
MRSLLVARTSPKAGRYRYFPCVHSSSHRPAPSSIQGNREQTRRAVLPIAEIRELAANKVNTASRTPRPAVHRPPRDPKRSIAVATNWDAVKASVAAEPGP